MLKKILASLLITFMCLQSCYANGLKVMVFAPHPDDELIGCGGSIAKHVKLGNQVTVVYLTSGDAGNIKFSKDELGKIREEEARRGMEILGVKDLVFFHNRDGYLEVTADNLIKTVELIRQSKPDVVYFPQAEDAHQDHKATHEIVSKAINKARGSWFQEAKGEPWSVKTIFTYEVYPLLAKVNYCEDITEFMALKYKGLKQHKSQLDTVAYDDVAKSMSRYRGALNSGTKYAECFQLIKIGDLFK